MRTWAFSIASKRAQDHQNRSPDVKVMHVSIFGIPAVFLWAGCPGLGRMSGLPGRPGCPGSSRMSGRPCPVTIPKVWLCPPDVRHLAGCPGPESWPDVRALPGYPGPLFFYCVCVFCVGFLQPPDVRPLPGCPARLSHLH